MLPCSQQIFDMSIYLYPDSELRLANRCFELTKKLSTIGRHPDNDVALLLESVSRFHARIEMEDSGCSVTDLNSSNGTFVNGQRITSPQALVEGDVITFGHADFVFSFKAPGEFEMRAAEMDAAVAEGQSSSVSIVGDEAGESTIISSQLNVDATPLPTSELIEREDLDSLRRANERLLTLYKLNEIIHASRTADEVLGSVLQLVFELLPADRGVIMLAEPDQTLLPRSVRFRKPDESQGVIISRTIMQKCMAERLAILCRDARVDPRFRNSESVVVHDIRSALCVPLFSKAGLLGIIFVDSKESQRAFTEDDLKFLASMANDVAMTLTNMELLQNKIHNERLAAVGRTIAGLAHNIKNILQLARGGVELLDMAMNKGRQDVVVEYWPVVRHSIDRMQSLTQEMLEYSRPHAPELRDANVNVLIRDTIRSYRNGSAEEGTTIELDLSPDIPVRRIDADGFFKALMNLVVNAVDACSGKDGRIVIKSSLINDTIFIRVEDNGKGIPSDKRSRLFEPFYTTKASKGTGLGLSMTRKYVEDMGGRISFESEEGRGTAFTIALPPLIQTVQFDTGDELTDA